MPTKNDLKEHDYVVPPSSLETIDAAVVSFVNKEMDLFATTNQGWKKTNVLWVAPERAYQRKKNKELRDADGTLILPLITVARTSFNKDPIRKGVMGVNIPAVRDKMGNQFTVGKVINQERTQRQRNARSARKKGAVSDPKVGHGQRNMRTRKLKTPVFDALSIPLPIYLDVTYKISIRAGYQQQMNELLTPFITRTGQKSDFRLKAEHHQYVAHFEAEYTRNTNTSEMQEEERVYETEISLIVNGYLIGNGPNQTQPTVARRMSAVKASFGREHCIVGVINEWMEDDEHRGKLRQYYEDLGCGDWEDDL